MKAASTQLWRLGLEPRPDTDFKTTAAHQKVVDDAIRAAAEELTVAPGVLRPVVARFLQALAQGAIPPGQAARMVVEKGKT